MERHHSAFGSSSTAAKHALQTTSIQAIQCPFDLALTLVSSRSPFTAEGTFDARLGVGKVDPKEDARMWPGCQYLIYTHGSDEGRSANSKSGRLGSRLGYGRHFGPLSFGPPPVALLQTAIRCHQAGQAQI